MPSSWDVADLKKWDDKIIKIANSYNLDWFPINYEICDYYEMIGHMSYHGMPSHYNHWSFGKSFERTHFMYNQGQSGLPYELIINSNPSIAYLMRENPLYLQILIMAHCVGHSDFFKNNRCFKNTDPEHVVSRMRNAKKRAQEYVENPNIGQEKVEDFFDNLHAINFQTNRYDTIRRTKEEIKKSEIERYNAFKEKGIKLDTKHLNNRLLKPDYDLLSFFMEYYPDKFENWQLDIINTVKNDSLYFIPQIKTKILNEGWASFWHYKILHELKLDDKYHLPFLKMHNAVVRPHIGGLNPYHLGFHLFTKIEEKYGLEKCFEIREIHDDISAIRLYFDEEDIRELNIFSYVRKKGGDVYIEKVADHDEWKAVKNEMIRNISINKIPHIYCERVEGDGTLVLKHEHDGRDLDLQYANKVVEHIKNLWKKNVKLYTLIEDEIWEI
jgi:stage V sporulation protein R